MNEGRERVPNAERSIPPRTNQPKTPPEDQIPRGCFPTFYGTIARGEALAIFERDLIIHFQQISRAAALYVRALLGGIKRALEIYRRVDESTKNFPGQPRHRRKVAHACRRCLDGGVNHLESSDGSVEECTTFESSA